MPSDRPRQPGYFTPPAAEDLDQITRLSRQMAEVLRDADGVIPMVAEVSDDGLSIRAADIIREEPPSEPSPLSTWRTVVPKPKKVKVYAWPVVSSREVGEEGLRAKYTVFLYEDATLSCDCPGWIFHHQKNDGCKHTRQVEVESATLHSEWKAGGNLPQLEAEEGASGPQTRVVNTNHKSKDIPFGRSLDI